MSRYQPPFTITPFILNQVVEIGELLGHWAAHSGRTSPLLRKENRIRTIQASLAIEHNSLTTGQVTAIMDGKRVLAPEKIFRKYAMLSWHMRNCPNGSPGSSTTYSVHTDY